MNHTKQLRNSLIFTVSIIILSLLGGSVHAATVLSPGDIFVLTVNSTNPDTIDFVSRVDIDTGTILYMSDDGITSAGLWRGTEGYITMTFTSSITKGTIIRANDLNATPTLSPSVGTIIRTGPFDISTTSENIFFYQGPTYNTSSSFLYGLGFGGTVWITSGTPISTNSYLPSPLSLGTSAVEITYTNNNIQYNCSNESLFNPFFISDIHSQSNWNSNNSIRYGLSPCVFNTTQPPILSLDLGSGQADFTSGTTVRFQIESSDPIDASTLTCSDIIFTGEYDNISCDSITELNPFDKTLFEVSASVSLGVDGYGDLTVNILTGAVSTTGGIADIGTIILNNYILFDILAPELTLNGSGTMTIESGDPFTDLGATCSDNWDSTCTVTTSGSINTYILGTQIITYNSTDEVGNSNSITRTVIVQDTLPPTEPIINININSPYGINNPEIIINGSTDLHLSGYMISIDGSSFELYTGTYYPILTGDTHTVIVRSYDTSGNYTEKITYYPPVVNIIAPTTLSNTGITDTTIEITSAPGDNITSIVFSGVGGGFNCGTLPALVPITCTGGTITTSGTLEVYASNGIFTGSNTQTYIIDTQDPIITLIGGYTQTIEGGTPRIDPGYTCTDNIDITCVVNVSGTVDHMTLGTYIIEYITNDNAGNTTSAIRTVVVQDTTSPNIILHGDNPTTIPWGGTYTESGASWTDNIDGSGSISGPTSGTSIDPNGMPGTYYLEYSYSDGAGNTGSHTRTVIISNPPIPDAQDDYFTGNQNTNLDISLGQHISNDNNIYAVVSGSAVIEPSHGTYTLAGYGFIYIPDPGFVGVDTMVYSICNILNECDTATITLTILSTSGSSGTGSSGGGGYTLQKDMCPDGDQSPSYYDGICIDENSESEGIDTTLFNPTISNTCFTPLSKKTIDQGNNVSQAFKNAHQVLYSYKLTTWRGTADYRPYDYLTRAEAAKFMVEFAQNILCRTTTRSYNDNFSDLQTANSTLTQFIKASYDYEIFNGNSDGTFRPNDRISNDELAAIMVRLVTNTMLEEPEGDWAKNYRNSLQSYAKLSSLNNQGRGNIAEVIYDLYRNNEYHLNTVGYVINKK